MGPQTWYGTWEFSKLRAVIQTQIVGLLYKDTHKKGPPTYRNSHFDSNSAEAPTGAKVMLKEKKEKAEAEIKRKKAPQPCGVTSAFWGAGSTIDWGSQNRVHTRSCDVVAPGRSFFAR